MLVGGCIPLILPPGSATEDEEHKQLKQNSIGPNKARQDAGKPKSGPIFTKRPTVYSRLTYRKRIKEIRE